MRILFLDLSERDVIGLTLEGLYNHAEFSSKKSAMFGLFFDTLECNLSKVSTAKVKVG